MAAEAPFHLNALDHLLHNAMDGILVIDRDRRYVFFNEAMEKLTGYASGDLVDKDCVCAEILECRDEQGRRLSSVLCPAKDLFEGRRGSARQRLQIRRKDGSILWVETIYTAVPGTSGEVEYVLGVLRDISDAKTKEDELLQTIATLRHRAVGPFAGEPLQAAPADETAASATARYEDNLRLDPLLARCEREAILRALSAAHGQRNKAAQLMGISRSRLYRRIDALGVDLKGHP